jgi:hypothetical protein
MFSNREKMLLMGSSRFRAKELPKEIQNIINKAIENEMTFIVAEAHGSCRLFQDYLAEKKYRNVIIGNARSIRYNVGDYSTIKYGDNLKERELNMIRESSSAIVIWQDNSGTIAENLENLKKYGIPTFLYEQVEGKISMGMLDPNRTYRKYYPYNR